jgi:hypothetical protein
VPRKPTPWNDGLLRGGYTRNAILAQREKDALACACVLNVGMKMNQQNLVAKLNQIVEQAQLTLQDPKSLTAERLKMIIALARFVSTEMTYTSPAPPDA